MIELSNAKGKLLETKGRKAKGASSEVFTFECQPAARGRQSVAAWVKIAMEKHSKKFIPLSPRVTPHS